MTEEAEECDSDWEVVVAEPETNFCTTVMAEKVYSDERSRNYFLKQYRANNDSDNVSASENNPAYSNIIANSDQEDCLVVRGEQLISCYPFEVIPVKVQVWKHRNFILLPIKRIIEIYDGTTKLYEFQLASNSDIVKVVERRPSFKGRKYVLKLLGGLLTNCKKMTVEDNCLLVAYEFEKDWKRWKSALSLLF